MRKPAKVIAIAVAAVLAVTSAYVAGSNPFSLNANVSPPREHDGFGVQTHDDQTAMLERGNIAMGFDQNKIAHHFIVTSTGGQILIIALDRGDRETIDQIKTHVIDIQQEFSQGNFAKPFFIHAQEVPGTRVMEEKKDLIEYSIEESESGTALVLTTDNPELLQAIKQFMEFQSNEHHGH